jgi:hypothetical protein
MDAYNNNNNNTVLNKDKKGDNERYKKKPTNVPFEIDQDIKAIDLKPIEQRRLDIVYEELSKLEQEASSDDDSLEKKYLKEIERNAEQKRMDQKVYKQSKSKGKKKKDNLEESEQSEKSEVNKKQEIKIGKKALRKMLRLYISPKLYGPEEIEDMIWEVDEDMDGRVSKYEMEKMYKRCIVDKQELEPKKLFYFIMFLMFDKENKRSINEEDTLELLRVRNRDDKAFNAAIDEIFNPDGKKKAKAKNDDEEERITFEEYVNVMTNLVLKKRDQFKDKRENYCNHIQDELKKSNSVSKYK